MELHDREVTTYAALRAKAAEQERRTDLRSQPPLPRKDKAKCGHHIRLMMTTCTPFESVHACRRVHFMARQTVSTCKLAFRRPIAAPKPLLGVVKVKPVAPVKSTAAARQARPAPSGEQPAKKQKVEARAAKAAASKAEDSDVGLPGLIGAYGSDSDDDSASQDEATDARPNHPAPGAPTGSAEVRSATHTDSDMPSGRAAADLHAVSDQGAEELDYET